jgi:GT2 family glycosyltransferase
MPPAVDRTRTLASFANAHAGGSIIVCACGESLNALTCPERFVTIGVNDVGRKFDPNYLVVVDPREQFKGDRFKYVETSRAGYVFTQRTDLDIDHLNVVPFRLGSKDGTGFSNPDVLNYSVTTPYVALCLAVHMGATNIGLIGVDFTDNHFFAPTGPHPWASHITTIDGQFEQLAQSAFARGSRIFNLSPGSRLTAVPKMALETFETLANRKLSVRRSLRVVSYATTPLVGVPAILERCINAHTPHHARCVWASDSYPNGISFAGDISWSASPARAMAVLEAADVVVVHNGKVNDQHRQVLTGKPVVTVAHNYMSNVDDGLVRLGFPGVVAGQYQATLPEFQGWPIVPNPIALWEHEHDPRNRGQQVTIAYTPSGKHDVYPGGHPLYWHGKGHGQTIRVLDALAARYPIRLEVTRDRFVSHAEARNMKRRAHILIDECVTGSYHRNSLEGLAAGCVVINGVGSLPGVAEALRDCAGSEAGVPFIRADLTCLESILELLIGLGPDAITAMGAENRFWLERHWNFANQWDRFWQPAIDEAMRVAERLAVVRRPAECAVHEEPRPDVSVVIASLNEGALLRSTVDSFAASLPPRGEIIVVDDASTDGSADFLNVPQDRMTVLRQSSRVGTAKARDAGVRQARGRIVVFSDAHVAVPRGWFDHVSQVLTDPDVGAIGPAIRAMRFPDDYKIDTPAASPEPRGFGMSWSDARLRTVWLEKKQGQPYDVPLLNGAFIAMRRTVFASIGGYDPGLDAGGVEDAELSFRLWTLGYRCVVVPNLDVAHLFRTERPYPVGWEQIVYNKLRVATLHFHEQRRRNVIETLRGNDAFPASHARLGMDDTRSRGDRLRALRLRDDDWFFRYFRDDSTADLAADRFTAD